MVIVMDDINHLIDISSHDIFIYDFIVAVHQLYDIWPTYPSVVGLPEIHYPMFSLRIATDTVLISILSTKFDATTSLVSKTNFINNISLMFYFIEKELE